MDFGSKIEDDLNSALKSRDSLKVSVLRMIRAVFQNKEIEKRGKGNKESLTEDEAMSLLGREVKKRKESIDLFKKGNREDLAKKEIEELKIIEKYLPTAIGEEEVSKMIDKILEGKNYGVKDFGIAIKEVMKELRGKAGGDMVSGIIKKKLGS